MEWTLCSTRRDRCTQTLCALPWRSARVYCISWGRRARPTGPARDSSPRSSPVGGEELPPPAPERGMRPTTSRPRRTFRGTANGMHQRGGRELGARHRLCRERVPARRAARAGPPDVVTNHPLRVDLPEKNGGRTPASTTVGPEAPRSSGLTALNVKSPTAGHVRNVTYLISMHLTASGSGTQTLL